ncbi:cytochrome P450 [Chiua virens]|nr:cytochrome P450 [Chiua virens]
MSFVHDNVVGVLPSWTYVAGGAAAAAAFVILSKTLAGTHSRKNNIPLPPGPPAVWFWEDPMPKQKVAVGIAKLIEEHGPVISFRRGSQVTIVVGRMDPAAEILEKQGAVLVDRPRSVAVGEILSGGMHLVLQPAGDRLRRMRRAAYSHLQPKVAMMYEEIQAEAAKGIILDILNHPKQVVQHAERYASAVILRVMYGKSTPTSNDDPEVVRVKQTIEKFQSAFAQIHLVDYFPWLKHMPGYGRQLREVHQLELALFRDQLKRVKQDMERNTAGPSFARMLLENVDEHQLTDVEMGHLAGGFYAAGSDTTASGITIMFMAAACYPDAQARVQKELDEVVGKDRRPTFEDRDVLPQLQAFILEAARWIPVTPLGIPHRAMKDIFWKGYWIPAGATVIGSHWAISRDPVAFPDPDTFNPQRWLTEDGAIRTDTQFYMFGFGRRVCPGQHVADRSLFITLALLLWSFRISQRPEAPIDTSVSGGGDLIVFHPKPFEAEFVPRIEELKLRELMT